MAISQDDEKVNMSYSYGLNSLKFGLRGPWGVNFNLYLGRFDISIFRPFFAAFLIFLAQKGAKKIKKGPKNRDIKNSQIQIKIYHPRTPQTKF